MDKLKMCAEHSFIRSQGKQNYFVARRITLPIDYRLLNWNEVDYRSGDIGYRLLSGVALLQSGARRSPIVHCLELGFIHSISQLFES